MIRVPRFVSNPDPSVYHSNNYTVLDFETTTKVHGSAVEPTNRIVCACWFNGPDHPRPGRHYVWGTEFDMSPLVLDIRDAEFLVAHNSKFELQWLRRCGLELEETLVYDTKIADYVLGGNLNAGFRSGLNHCLDRHGIARKIDVVGMMFKAGIDTTEIAETWVLRYCRWDVEVTHRLMRSQLEQLTPALLAVTYARCLLTPVLADIEFNGMHLDVTRVTDMTQQKQREINELERSLEAEFGTTNINGTLEKQRLFYEDLGFDVPHDPRTRRPALTPTGRPKTDEATLSRLRATSVRQRRFLELYSKHRGLHSELTKYLRTFNECADAGGILRGEFHQTRTRTHRLSSSGLDYTVQFQNLPREYKSLFVPRREGWLMGEVDGSQLEFRVAAHLGRDAQAILDIENGVDIHAGTANIIGCTRQEAKAHTFKPLYGGRSGSPDEVRYYTYFREHYKGIADTQAEWVEHVLRDKCLTTEWGLTYYWPDTTRTRDGYITNSTSIHNYPVQALATAEIIPACLIYMWHTLKRSDYIMQILNTIHDSVVVELPEEETDAFRELSKVCFTEAPYSFLDRLYGVKLVVPLGCDAKCGDAWGRGDTVSFKADERLYKHG